MQITSDQYYFTHLISLEDVEQTLLVAPAHLLNRQKVSISDNRYTSTDYS